MRKKIVGNILFKFKRELYGPKKISAQYVIEANAI